MSTQIWALLACAALVACGSSPANEDGGTDGGVDAPSACPEGGSDPGLAGAGAPVGTQLATGDALSIRAVTGDGWVVYSDDAAAELHAVPLAGGAPSDLGPLGSKFWVVGFGDVVFVWTNVSAANVGALATWTSAGGLHPIATASLGIVGSSDGTHVLYTDHAGAGGDVADVWAAAIDGSGATKLVAAAVVAGCIPALGFVGAYAVATHCSAPPNPNPLATISSFSTATWARVDLATGAENYWAAAAGGVLYSVDGAGIAVVSAAGGAATTIDANGFLGVLTADGKSALYGTRSHDLRRSPVASPSPTTLVTGGFNGFWALAPDEQHVLFFSQVGPGGGDMFLGATGAAGAPITLSTAATSATLGDAFTKDSSHALYATDLDPCTHAGTLHAVAVDAGAPVLLGEQTWAGWAPSAAKVVFGDGYFATGEARFGRVDVELVDLAQGSTKTRLVDRADAVLALSPSGDRVIYAWSARPGALAGLWSAPLP